MNTNELTVLAEQGNVDAMFNLGVTYSLGDEEEKINRWQNFGTKKRRHMATPKQLQLSILCLNRMP